MHIRSLRELERAKTDSSMSSSVLSQIETALKAARGRKTKSSKSKKLAPAQAQLQQVVSELGSAGEEALGTVLMQEFGQWSAGGEVVRELMPFTENRYRADYCLPRFLISIEIQGWTHHGKSVGDHHGDRMRELYFAARNWLVINVSHGQALKEHAVILETLKMAMSRRQPIPREQIQIHEHITLKNKWYKMSFVGTPADEPMALSPY